MIIETKYKVGDIISWYCSTDDEIHHAEVQFERKTLFIDEYDIIEPNCL